MTWERRPITKAKTKPQARKDREAEQKDLVAEQHRQMKRDFERRNPRWATTGER